MKSPSLIDRLMLPLARGRAQRTTRRWESALADSTATQRRVLLDKLARNADSDFGRRHGFDRIRTYADFAGAVPIQRYENVAPCIDRVRHGETRALFGAGQRVLMFALTSGTTAEPKYIPVTPTALKEWRRDWNVWGLRALLDHPSCILRPIFQISSPMDDHRSPAGIPCGAITGLLAATQKRLVRRYYVAPAAAARIADSTGRYYTLMRMAIPRDVSFLVTASPATLLLLARTADEHRERIIRDIRDGTLAGDLPIEEPVRRALAARLSPDPACARRLEQLVGAHGGLYPKHYWSLGFLAHWTGGTMGLYRPQLPRWYGEIPSRDIGLLASEGRMSIPLADGTAAGVLAVTSHFFEFIPAEEYGSARPTALPCGEVGVGREYFLVITTSGGLYRYDLGDRVRVTGFHGTAPVIEFLSRDAHTASLAGEKLTENQVVLAMQAARGAGNDAADFVLSPRWGETPNYRLYLEGPGELDAGDLAGRLDAALARINVEYDSKRKTRRLGALEVALVPEAFLAERDRRLRSARTRTAEQFKHQYLLPRPGLDSDLDAATIVPPRAPDAETGIPQGSTTTG